MGNHAVETNTPAAEILTMAWNTSMLTCRASRARAFVSGTLVQKQTKSESCQCWMVHHKHVISKHKPDANSFHIQISLESKTKHQSVMMWCRSGRVSAELAIDWGILPQIRCHFTWNWCETRCCSWQRWLHHRRLLGVAARPWGKPGAERAPNFSKWLWLKERDFPLNVVTEVCEVCF